VSLLKSTKCHTVLLADGAPAIAQEILAARSMQQLAVPEIPFFMNEGEDVEVYQWRGTFDEMKNETFLILHTSGSTGIPKPVFVTHGTFASNDAHQIIPSLGGDPTLIEFFRGKRFFIAFPPFHAANVFFTIGYNVFCGMTSVLPNPVPPTADIVNMIHLHGNLDGSVLPPSTITDIFNTSEYFVNMTQRLTFVAYVGGTLSKEVGNPIASQMKLITLMGSTELGYLPVNVVNRETAWHHLPISPFLGHQYRPARDGLSELVIIRNPKLDMFQGFFSIFPDTEEYATNDLYELDPEDPTNPKAWIYRARSDDIIAFSNAEKLNPVTIEAVIASHPAVNAALVAGQGEFQAALLIEPKVEVHTLQEKEILRHDIWPIIRRANQDCPAHGRILKDFVMFTSPGKPLPQAAKGTVQRYAALKLYAAEFEALYAASRNESEPKPDTQAAQVEPAVEDFSPFGESDTVGPAKGISVKNNSCPANVNPFADLDVHVEKVVTRLLPNALIQHLRPALARMMAEILEAPAAESQGILEHHGMNRKAMNSHAPNGSPTDIRHELQDGLRSAIANSTYMHGLNDTANFFDCGLDSLQVIGLTNEINEMLAKLRPDAALISKKTIYENPTFEELEATVQRSFVF